MTSPCEHKRRPASSESHLPRIYRSPASLHDPTLESRQAIKSGEVQIVVGEPASDAGDGSPGRDEHAIGQVIGTEDATPLVFHVALYPDAYLQLDDVVATSREVPGRGSVMTSGIVTQVWSRHEGATFGSDVFLASDGVLPARIQEIAEVTTTRVEPELYVPPQPGAPARRATGTERSAALYFDQMEHRLPVGVGLGTAIRELVEHALSSPGDSPASG